MNRLAIILGCIFGLAFGASIAAWASRTSGGTYALPAGNPVVTGTTITSVSAIDKNLTVIMDDPFAYSTYWPAIGSPSMPTSGFFFFRQKPQPFIDSRQSQSLPSSLCLRT